MRAISVKVNEVVGVAGFVVPGTRVDVMVTLSGKNRDEDSTTRVVLSNAQVLTAGTRYDQEKAKDGAPIPSTVVTLLVSPDDGERVALAAAEGQIMLTLRNPLDQDPTSTNGVRTAALFGRIVPEPVKMPAVRRGPAKPPCGQSSWRTRSCRLQRRGHSRRQAIAGDCPMTSVNCADPPRRAGGLALTLVLAGQCQLPTSAQQLARRHGGAADPGAGAPAVRPRARDCRAVDHRRDRFHGDSHRGDESRHRRRGGRAASRSARRRQEARDGQSDPLVEPTSASSTTSSSSRRSPRSSNSCRCCSRVKTSRSA